MSNLWKRSLSFALALMMVVSMVPMQAFATETETEETTLTEVLPEETAAATEAPVIEETEAPAESEVPEETEVPEEPSAPVIIEEITVIIDEAANEAAEEPDAADVAMVGETGYETLADAIAAAASGDTVTLLCDVATSEIITINKAITLDGNGKVLTSTAARAINVETSGNVVISNLTIQAGERAINIINQPANVTLNKVTATAKNNAVMLATSAENANLTVNDSHLTGLATVNVASANSVVEINDTTIVNVDASAAENYGAITVWTSAENANVTVNGGEIIVADDSRKAYVFPGSATVKGVDDIGYIIATVGDAGYESLEKAIEEAKNGDTVKLMRNVTASEIISIDKAITLDGNGKKLTSTAGRAINVTGAAANGVTIKNLTINVSGERGINVIQNANNVRIENCTIKAANYAVNATNTAPGAVITIVNSDLTGLNVVNIASANAEVTVTNTKILCNDQSATENYSALTLNQDAVGASIVATDVTFDIKGDSRISSNDAEGGSIVINGESGNEAEHVAIIEYGNYYYGFTTLEGAIEKAVAGETIKLLRDVTASEIITINKAITLDGSGKVLTSTAARAINVETSGNVVISNLTIQAGERAINIINQPANVTLNKVTATAKNNAVMLATSAENANLTVNDSHLTGLATVNVASANSVVTINDTTIVNVDASAAENYGAITIWTSAENANVTVSGGEIIVADDSRKAYVFPGSATVKGVDDIGYIISTVGDAGYESLEKAIEEAKNGDTVKLMRNVTASAIITINKAITLDGNGKKLTSTAGRAINVTGAAANGVTIKNLTINVSGERGINVIQNATNVLIEDCTIKAANYTVNAASSAPGAVITIKNSDLTGLNVVNIGAPNAKVTVTDGTILCNDQNENEGYGALSLNKDAVGGSIVANGVAFAIMGNSNKAVNAAEGGSIIIDGQDSEAIIDVAVVEYGNYYYGFDTVEKAIEYATAGETVKLIRDVTASAIITIDKAITLDGNGKTLTSTAARAINVETSGNVVISDLTIKAGERAINVINQPANVTLNNVTATANNNAVMLATSAENANLTVNDSHLTGLATVNVASANSVVEINDTTIVNVDASAAENYGAITIWTSAENANVTVSGGEIIVADDSRKAYVFPGSATVKGVDDIGYIIATVGDAGYESLEKAIEEAKNGETIEMMRNAAASAIITIDKAITLDGNGKVLTSTAARAINVETSGNVVISNLTIQAGERAINIINQPANVTLNNVTATAKNNAVMLATSAENASLTVNDSHLTGLATVNVASANSVVTINDTTIVNVDASAAENYGAITVWTSAENANVTVNGGEIIVADDSRKAYVFPGSATVKGVDDIGYIIATVGDAGYESLEKAIEEAKNGETIEMMRGLTIPQDATVTLDLMGKTISMSVAATKTSALITNNGTLTIKDSVGGGKLTYVSSIVNIGYSTSVIINNGTLTVESGIIENTSAKGGASYAVDNYNTLTVNGGTFIANGTSIRQAQFGNHDNTVIINGGESTGYAGLQLHVFSTAKKTTTVINGGTFNGTYAMFTAFDAAEDSGNTDITINGGTFNGTSAALFLYNSKTGAAEFSAAVKGGNFNSGIYAYIKNAEGEKVNLPIVSGGIFSEIAMNETDPAVLAENLVFVADENGNYHVEETAFPLMINHSYIAIEIDKTFDLDVVANPDGGVYSVVWDVESDKGIIEVDQNGLVTAKKVGTDYVLATIGSGDHKVTARCRVDVTEEDIKIEAVQLSTNKVTTELFSTNYAKLDVILLLEQNQPEVLTDGAMMSINDQATNAAVGLNLEDASLSITEAKFKNEAMNDLFDLQIADDRTLQIVPKTEKVLENPGLFKSSYKSEIVLTIRGEEIATELVSLTVKKTKPSVKATVEAFNSFYTYETRQIVFTGATVEKVALNPAKALPAAWLTVAGPAPAVEDEINWMNPDEVTLSLTADQVPVKSTSTNVYLKVMTAEWVIPVDVTLAVKNTYKARSLKLSASSISISAENSTGITLTLKPGNAKETWESLNVRDIEVVTDGFNVDTTNLIENGTFVLNTDQTFTNQVLQLKVLFNDTEAKLALPNLKVKQVAPKITMAPTTVKLNTLIDDSATVKLNATPADFQIGDVTLSLTDRNNKPVAENFDKLAYTIDPVTNEVTVKTTATTVSNEVYYLYATAGGAKAKLTVQTIGKAPTMSLSVKGAIDLSFPKTPAVVSAKLANCSQPDADFSIVITDKKGADVTDKFGIEPTADGYEILAGEGLQTGTYTAKVTALLNEGDVDEIKLPKTAKITVKRTAVKLKLSATKVSLNKRLDDVATVGVSCTTKGYEFVEPFLTYDATKLDVQYVDGNLLVKAVAEAGTRDQTFKVTVRAHEGATSAVTLNVVVLKKDAVVKSTIKATGMIDVIRDNTMITIKPTYTNALNVDVENQAQLVFYSNANKDNYRTPIKAEDVPFDVTVEDGAFILTANEKLLATVSYKAELVTTFCEKPSAKIALSVKMNNAKLVMHAEKTNKMYAQDINSRVTFSVASTDATVNEIRTVEVLDSKLSAAYRGIFKVIEYGNGEYAIGFVEGANISKVQGKTINVPVNVFIEGNESTKTNATLTLKITVVK